MYPPVIVFPSDVTNSRANDNGADLCLNYQPLILSWGAEIMDHVTMEDVMNIQAPVDGETTHSETENRHTADLTLLTHVNFLNLA